MHELFAAPLFGASSHGRDLGLLGLALGLAGALFLLLVAVTVLTAAVRHGLKPARTSRASPWLPAVWVAIPVGFVLAVFFWSVQMEVAHASAPADSLLVRATGRQWLWRFEHEEGPEELGELHLPLGVPVRLTFESEDVLHHFSLPAFGVQLDVLPGRSTRAWLRPERTGTFRFQCTEYCGAEHSHMAGLVHVLTPIEYEHWVTGDSENLTPQEAGERLYAAFRCESCHKPANDGPGPALQGRFGEEVQLADGSSVLYDQAYARESLLEPASKLVKGYQPVMPSYRSQLDESQVAQLVAYLESLSDSGATEAVR